MSVVVPMTVPCCAIAVMVTVPALTSVASPAFFGGGLLAIVAIKGFDEDHVKPVAWVRSALVLSE